MALISKPFLVLLLAGTILLAALPLAAESGVGRDQLVKLLPEPLPGAAVPQGDPAFYGPDNLYQYMNGAADLFVLYDVQTLFHQEFRAKEVDVTLDVFDMGSPENAFGIYAAERSPSYQFITIGAEAYRNEGILNFLQDRYYVKLAGFGTGADTVLEALARGLSGRIGGKASLPALLEKLPTTNRKARSEQYMPKDPLGHGFLSPAYVIEYGTADQESKLLVSVAPDDNEAGRRLKQLEKHLTSSGECGPAAELGEGAIRGSNSYEGKILAISQGRYLLMLINPAAGAEQLVRDAAKSLNQAH